MSGGVVILSVVISVLGQTGKLLKGITGVDCAVLAQANVISAPGDVPRKKRKRVQTKHVRFTANNFLHI